MDEDTQLQETPEVPTVYGTTSENRNCNTNSGIQTPPSSDIQQPKCDNPAVSRFYEQLSGIISEAQSKIMAEANILNTDFSVNMAAAIQRENDCHSEEKEKLLEEIRELHLCVGSLESVLEARRHHLETVIGKLQFQHNLVACSKAFYTWRLFVQNKKREAFLESIAVKHYEKNLMKKAFAWWFAQLKASWRKRMELKAHVEVVEMQRHIVDLYEARIRNLEDNLSEAGRKISTLQTKHKLYEESIKMPYLSPSHPLNLNVLNYQKDHPRQGAPAFTEKTNVRLADIDTSLCPECAIENNSNYVPIPPKYYNYSVAPPLRHVLRTDDLLTKDPSVTQAISYPPTGSSSSPRLCRLPGTKEVIQVPDPKKLVVCHVPRHQPPVSAKSSRPHSSKFPSEKKVV